MTNTKYLLLLLYIKDISFYVPEKIITNDDLSSMMDTSDEWISTRTGIKKRHSVGDTNMGPADLAVYASEKLFKKANITKDEIDFVVSRVVEEVKNMRESSPLYKLMGSEVELSPPNRMKRVN